MLGPYTIAVLLCKLVPTQPGNWTPTWAPNWNFTESTVIQPTASKYFNPNHTYGLVSIDFQTGKRAACLWTESFRAHRAGHCHVPVTRASFFVFWTLPHYFGLSCRQRRLVCSREECQQPNGSLGRQLPRAKGCRES